MGLFRKKRATSKSPMPPTARATTPSQPPPLPPSSGAPSQPPPPPPYSAAPAKSAAPDLSLSNLSSINTPTTKPAQPQGQAPAQTQVQHAAQPQGQHAAQSAGPSVGAYSPGVGPHAGASSAYGAPHPGPPATPGPAPAMPPRQMHQPHGAMMSRAAALGTTWMEAPVAGLLAGCLPGLEYLAMLDTVVVVQQLEPLEIATGYETCNSYALHNAMGQMIYFCFEQSNDFARQMIGANRPFTLHIVGNYQNEVMRIVRPYKAFSDQMASHECQVESPPGNVIGWIRQRPGFTNGFMIQDASGQVVLHLTSTDRSNYNFFVTSPIGANVGEIRKMWTGIVQEMYTDADNFGVRFPVSMPVAHKALLLGATFLIDFVFFEINAPMAARPGMGHGGYGGYGGYGWYGGYGGYGGYGHGVGFGFNF